MSLSLKIYESSPIWLQNVFCTTYGYRQKRMRYGRHFEYLLDWLKESQWWPLQRLRDYQNQELKKIVELAYLNVPFYRERFKQAGVLPQDIMSVEDLTKLPILTKEQVIGASDSIHNASIPKHKLIHGHTSGTTGTALHMVYTKKCIQFQWAVWWRHRARFGMTPKNKEANFSGNIIVPYEQQEPPFWRENKAFNQSLFSQFHLKPDFMKYYLQKLNHEAFDYYAGYPSVIYLLADYLEQTSQKLRCPPKVVFTGAETLLEHQKTLIEKNIAKPTDEYGAGEYAANATKCEYDYFHIDMEFGILEIIPLEDFPQNKDEVIGKIVVTGLANPAMPLIRYEMNDIATLKPNYKCPCGRQSPVLKYIDGRIDSYVITRDGRRIGRLGSTFKKMNWIKEAQMIQNQPGVVIIKVVPRFKYSKENIDYLLKECNNRLGNDMEIQLDFVNDIPRTASGKFRAVISNIRI